MDTNETNETSTDLTTSDESFGKELAKTFARTTVTSAGVWAGIIGTLYAIGSVSNWLKDRKAKKALKDQTPTETAS